MEFDKDLIEASFATQYGIRLSQEPDITYAEYSKLLAGLMPETPLGRIVQIRAEKDQEMLSKFGVYERQLRNDWQAFIASKKTQEYSMGGQEYEEKRLINLQNSLSKLFGKG